MIRQDSRYKILCNEHGESILRHWEWLSYWYKWDIGQAPLRLILAIALLPLILLGAGIGGILFLLCLIFLLMIWS